MDHNLHAFAARYPALQVLLHWISAVVILWTLLSAGYVLLFARGSPVGLEIANFNVALTTLFIPLFLFRCWLRYTSPARGGAPTGVARIVHLLLYGVTVLVLVTGVLMMDRPIDLFGWVQIPQPVGAHEWAMGFALVHRLFSAVLALLVAAHVLAVIWHECSGRPILWRMQIKFKDGCD
ncbi:hypothetical protein D3C77_457460 [compost metagenome]